MVSLCVFFVRRFTARQLNQLMQARTAVTCSQITINTGPVADALAA
jgi:hypothetical protein